MTGGLQDHLQSGATTVARAWAVTRADGAVLGFTDHDCDLTFDGVTFAANAGLSARALEQVTGLAVDNSEAAGALVDAGLNESDIMAGRYDGAGLVIWQVNWADVAQRRILFRGSLGEITRAGGAFRAELRGLSEALNTQGGRVYHAACNAVLGDGACGFNLNSAGYFAQVPLIAMDGAELRFAPVPSVSAGWFAQGRVIVQTGQAAGLTGLVRADRADEGARVITLWDSIRAPLAAGDMVRLEAGCDKQAGTCRLKFANFLNFRGFPHIPGEDWMTAYPRQGQPNRGGRIRG
ncbi:DUF2163 domain-containing protein [Roseinatronobacter alkalisoli]|uniref:DUF2163 domain-containing protein n=1 Tax=Roseinatronobacter alkalisoli TaxID=3028235 RepID=A0ABT5T888_9RHOB|nr:DUF2163 domain-containing protein [Roseinatronobacter sp. HJB301]MDD7971339.1 DUF2163 domain-containing protein [Roseinatronobacter sp. HJB301]